MKYTINKAAIAYAFLFANFNLNLWGFDIPLLPNAVGWYLLLQVMGTLQEEAPSLELLVNPARILLVISFSQFVPGLDTFYPLIHLLITLLGNLLALYFHFQFLTNLADLLALHGYDILPLYRSRTILTIATTISTFTYLVGPDWMMIPMIISVFAGITVALQLRQYSK